MVTVGTIVDASGGLVNLEYRQSLIGAFHDANCAVATRGKYGQRI